ncbi:MAG TPA: S-methyl-5'-thioinosine phosphorylase [Burkholderiales bacterium]
MTKLAIIGGSGLTQLENLEVERREVARTPYGEPSGPMVFGRLQGREVVFLPRHGPQHTIPPHQVNYRANVWALRQAGVERVIAVAAVGGIADGLQATDILFPDQIIDYTYGRAHTFFDGEQGEVRHVDFTYPYCPELRALLIAAAARAGIAAVESGTYAATQGPRFETAAEIRRLERDGADVVGMTGMPEAALARELGLRYAAIAVVVNRAAGKEEAPISLKEIEANLRQGMAKVRRLLEHAIPLIVPER